MAQTKNEFGWTLLATATASASATIDFDSGIDFTAYAIYKVFIYNLEPAVDNTGVWMRFSNDGGSTYKSGTSDYGVVSHSPEVSGTNVYATRTYAQNITSAGEIIIGDDNVSVGNTAGDGRFQSEVTIFNPSSTDDFVMCSYHSAYGGDNTNKFLSTTGMGAYRFDRASINGIRFLLGSGNITAGEFKLYGIN